MYSKNVTEKIVEYWALGFSAEETREAIQEKQKVSICLTTIYKHRHSLTAQQMIDELMRKQLREILQIKVGLKGEDDQQLSPPNPEAALKYRNELLKILLPTRIESLSMSIQKTEATVNVSVEDLLKQYEDLLEEATVLENAHPEPVHPTQANHKASAVSAP